MTARIAAFVIAVLDTLGWLLVAANTFWSGSDQATIGLDHAAGLAVSALYAVTGLPALVLAALDRRPRLALTLALALPVAFAVLFVIAVVAFA